MRRHFTATGFVVDGDRTILHWHRKLGTWMPPGGHVEEDEEPIEALLREIREETGLEADVISDWVPYTFERPGQLPPPRVILVEDIGGDRPDHQHIDLIYYCRSLGPAHGSDGGEQESRWVTIEELEVAEGLELDGRVLPLADDVRILAIEAIRAVGARVEC
ncbi:MAG TPA: NUDIX domain-containing protein [Dehalococcoidia bacterium]|nr:NUDIX domain-containing protein [Dehalococcoidia bacterium]